MSEEINDVRRALTIVFRGAEGLARPDVERAFSFDMEWVAPHEAEAVVDALLNAGWLEEKSGELHLHSPLGEVDVPFGWFPRPTRLLRPVAASAMLAADASPLANAPLTAKPPPRHRRLTHDPLPRPLLAIHERASRSAWRDSSLGKAGWNWRNCIVERIARSRRSNLSRPGWPMPWSLVNKAW